MLDGIVIDLSRPARRRTAKAESNSSKARPSSPAAAKPRAEPAKAKPDPMHGYTAHRRVTYVGRQRCTHCHVEREYIAGDLLEYTRADRVGGIQTTRTRAFDARDYRWQHLPHAVEYLEVELCICAECLRTERAFDRAVQALQGIVSEPVQIPLFV